ncbi:polyadenylate-binding protein family protein [Striga asiatica]|uniref:Polyadenylate-binding protein family protein n=1 Tax=Striga asiatica TaxID=4170 RepID=A0A5A7QCV0_STRAF|nr:polyadenylate-binding protein family protein [Striga asiatica]
MDEEEHEVYGGEIPDEGEMEADADVDMPAAEDDAAAKELDEMKKRLKEMEEEAAALREMQAKVEKEMGAVQDPASAAAQASKEEVDSRSVFVGNHYKRGNGDSHDMLSGQSASSLVCQVDYACTPEEVQQHFQACGTVNRVTILSDKFGQPKGFAYVEFLEQEAVQEALQLNESELHGRQLKVMAKRTNVPGMKQYRGRRFNPYFAYGFRRPYVPPFYSPYGVQRTDDSRRVVVRCSTDGSRRVVVAVHENLSRPLWFVCCVGSWCVIEGRAWPWLIADVECELAGVEGRGSTPLFLCSFGAQDKEDRHFRPRPVLMAGCGVVVCGVGSGFVCPALVRLLPRSGSGLQDSTSARCLGSFESGVLDFGSSCGDGRPLSIVFVWDLCFWFGPLASVNPRVSGLQTQKLRLNSNCLDKSGKETILSPTLSSINLQCRGRAVLKDDIEGVTSEEHNEPHWKSLQPRTQMGSPKPAHGCSGKCNLLSPEGSAWDKELIEQTFNPQEAQLILSTALNRPRQSDCLKWWPHKLGNFTVKSAYSLILKSKQLSTNAPESGQTKLLEAKEQLLLKGIQTDPICRVCGTTVESLEHILFSCSRAINVWKIAGIDWVGFQNPSLKFKTWWTDICNMKRVKSFNDRIHFSSYILWRLWKCRNLWIFNNTWKSDRDIANQAWKEWMEYEDPSLNAS